MKKNTPRDSSLEAQQLSTNPDMKKNKDYSAAMSRLQEAVVFGWNNTFSYHVCALMKQYTICLNHLSIDNVCKPFFFSMFSHMWACKKGEQM